MNPTTAGILFIVALAIALALGIQAIRRLHASRGHRAQTHARVERVIYKAIGVNPEGEQPWGVYARSVLAFSAVSVLVLYLIQRIQAHLPDPGGTKFTGVAPALSWNTAVSFVTNTNWQAYSGESTMTYVTQMSGLAVQNFLSAAVGISVAVALVRGFRPPDVGRPGRRQRDRHDRQFLGRPDPDHPAYPAADRGGRRDRARRGRRDPELPRHRCDHAGRRYAAHHRRPGGEPGSHQGTRHQRRRLLQRQQCPPVREPERPGRTGSRCSCC